MNRLYLQRAEKIIRRINELAQVSEDKTCVTRTFGTPAFISGAKKVLSWMNLAGLNTRIDNIGNVRGVLLSKNTAAKTLVIASHIDTVVNAGKFDGPLGVIMGLDAIEAIIENEIELPYHIELIAFSDEEGVRFHTTYLGSRVIAGSFTDSLLQMKDAEGTSLKLLIESMGFQSALLAADAIPAENWLGYFEMHIEQGPVLYKKNIPVAIVQSIAGQQRAEVTFRGEAGHAGTVPMDMRYDALCCAAELVLEIEKYATMYKNNLVATVGKLQIKGAASNVIPGEVSCSVDLRCSNQQILANASQSIKRICSEIGTRRNVTFDWRAIQGMPPVICDSKMNFNLKKAIVEAGCQVVELASGAGHDAVAISSVAPVCMMFVRCYKGISHNPQENVEMEDIASAAMVCDNFLQQMAIL